MNSLDYSALRDIPTLVRVILRAEGNWRQHPGAKVLYILWAIFCLPLTLIIFWPIIAITTSAVDGSDWSLLIVFAYIAVFIAIAGIPKRYANHKAAYYITRFFTENNLLHASTYNGFDYPYGNHTLQFRHRYEAIILDEDDRIIVWVSTLSLPLARHVPHIVLDSLGNNRLMSSLTHQYDDSQRISLEGDFNKYYELYAPKLHRVEALSILSPDVMATLIDSGAQFDIELDNGHLTVRTLGHVLTEPDTLEAMHAAMTAIAPEILHRMRSWHQSNADTLQLLPARATHAVQVGPVNIPLYTRWLGPASEYGAYALVVLLACGGFGLAAYRTAFEQHDPIDTFMLLIAGAGAAAFGVLVVAAFDSRLKS